MSQHTATTRAPESAARTQVEKDYVAEVATLWQELAHEGTSPSGSELAAALATRLGLPVGAAQGVLQGFQSLLHYALSEQAAGSTALEEERASVQVALATIRPVLAARLQQRLDEADARTPEVTCEQCRRRCEAQGRRRRTWLSTVGALSLRRRYGWCARCGQGRAPAQAAVGLPANALTAGLEEVTTLLATTVPHTMAVQLVQQMLGLEVSTQAVKSSVERRAEQVIRLQDEEAQEVQNYQAKWEKSPPYLTTQAPARAVDVAYLELDGVLVLTREETARDPAQAGRGGPGRHYEVTGREVKNAILYEDTACVQESERRGAILAKTYLSVLGTWLPLACLIWVALLKRGWQRARLLVVLSDGAEWIRSLCHWLPVPVLLILDLYHVKHKLWEMAAALYGEGTAAARTWAQEQGARIEAGAVGAVLAELVALATQHPKAREQLASVQTYLRRNQDRMDYPSYRAQGLRVGSGAIESTNYHVTGARLKLQGMRWSRTGAAQMARLRADLFNGVWQARSRQILLAA
jgi:Uncharacterised protein family (UPF0236)